jgi:hypothetical protein
MGRFARIRPRPALTKHLARLAPTLALTLTLAPLHSAWCQTLNARSLGMGGVVLPGGGGEGFNAAYRAVPAPPNARHDVPLPLGLVQLAMNPPVLDPNDPDFDIYELSNQVFNPPWNLQLVSPQTPSDDIVVELGRDRMAIQLGEIRTLFPDRRSTLGNIGRGPAFGVGVGPFYAGAAAEVHYENDLLMNPALHDALARGEPFETNTRYALEDSAVGQAVASFEVSWAGPIVRNDDTRIRRGMALFGGVRPRLLRGLAYGSSGNVLTFDTADTLLKTSPVELDYQGFIRQAGPGSAGWGHSLDLGAVWMNDALEIGLGVNDVVSRVHWAVEESSTQRDTVLNDFTRTILANHVPFSSELPATTTLNVAYRTEFLLVAADAVHSMGRTSAHLGGEVWFGPLATRAGLGLDTAEQLQFGGGVGLRLGRVGLDLGLATHSRNLSRERGLELGAGLALYR